MERQIIGCIDIGRTKILVGIADTNASMIDIIRIPTTLALGPTKILEDIGRRLEKMVRATNSSLAAIGVGCPGPLDLGRGVVLSPPDFPGWTEVPLVKFFNHYFKTLVILDNDANAAAMGEYRFGVARGLTTIAYVTVSTGIGGGLIVNGQLIHGPAGSACEIGHMTVLHDGPICACGARGCLNAISSGSAIAATAREQVLSGKNSLLNLLVKDASEIS
jgi:glucokinase